MFPDRASAQRVSPARSFSTADGLAHYSVNRIVRDSRGFLWFCTREGLSMFDGYGFTTYRTDDGLPSSTVTDVLEAPEGIYWIGTIEGLVRFDPAARQRFTVVPAPGDSRTAMINRLVRDPSGRVWVATANGLFWFDPARRPLTLHAVDLAVRDELQATNIQTLMADRQGRLWIANGPRLFVRTSDGALETLLPAPGRTAVTVGSLRQDRSGRVWAATNAGLWQFTSDGAGGARLLRALTTADGLPYDAVWDVMERDARSLWVVAGVGLFRVDFAENGSKLRSIKVADLAGHLEHLEEDASGHLWVGTGDRGAMRLPRLEFAHIAQEGRLAAITETRSGEVAILGVSDGALAVFCWDGTRVRPVRPQGDTGLPSWAWNQILLHDSSGDWWIGTYEGIFRFSGAATCAELHNRQPVMRIDIRSGLTSDIAMRLFEDSRGDLWISTVGHGVTPDGLARWERRSGALHQFSGRDGLPTFERHYVSAFAEDRAGNVWIGFSRDAGLARYRNGRFELFTSADGLPAGQIRDLKVDRSGRLWIASYRRGVCRVDDPTAARPTFRGYTTANGLGSNETHGLAIDASDRIYIASAHGVERLDPVTGLIKRYWHADDMPAGGVNAILNDRHGTVWLTTQSGAFRFVPAEERPAQPVHVLLTALSINGEPQPLSAVGERELGPLTLPSSRNSLQVTFVALGGESGGLAYRYRLGDEPWSQYSAERTINFANLSPRDYRLVVEARDAQGRVSEHPAMLIFTIVPPVWQQRWFLASMVMLAAVAAFGLHRHRMRRVLEVTRIRDRIAADLHDDLGANLTKIAVLGEVARQQGPRREGALASIAGIARESIATMGDIIWAIDPERDTMHDVVRKMRQHASETFAHGETALTFRAPSTLDGRPVDIQLRHDLFLLFKEAINNIARHSRCRRVEVGLDVAGETLRLRVSDDGVGFDPDIATDGRGTGSMRRRAARMGGRLDIASVPGRGTTLELNVRLR